MITILLYVEALEDNEVIFIENVRQFNRLLTDSNKKPFLEPMKQPKKVSVCLMYAEDYSKYPESQFEEDNVLRELNKCLLAFRQNNTCPILPKNTTVNPPNHRINSLSSIDSCPESETKDRERNSNAQRR